MGTGPIWGYVEGGMGRVSFAIAEAAQEAGATLAAGVPVGRILPGEGVRLESGELIRSRAVALQRRPEADARACSTRVRCPADVPAAARGLAGRARRWSS